MRLSKYGAEITMPFTETEEQFSAIKPHEQVGTFYSSDAGYHGIGFYKKDDTHFIRVDFSIGKYVKYLDMEIDEYTVITDKDYTYLDNTTIFKNNRDVITIYNAAGKQIKTIDNKVDFDVTNN